MKQTLDVYLLEYDYSTTDYNQNDFCYRNEPEQPWNAEIYGMRVKSISHSFQFIILSKFLTPVHSSQLLVFCYF